MKKPVQKTRKKEKKAKTTSIQALAMQFIENPTDENFNILCKRINWGLRGYIYKIVKDDTATTEVMSKTLENIYYKYHQFNPEIAQFSTWMYRIALNNSLKYVQEQKAGRSMTADIDFEDLYDSTICADADQSGPADSFAVDGDILLVKKDNDTWDEYEKERILTEMYDASVKCISYLPDNYRIVMSDRLLNSKKIDEIAYDNNIPISSVKNWLRKGKIALQDIVKAQYPILYDMYADLAV